MGREIDCQLITCCLFYGEWGYGDTKTWLPPFSGFFLSKYRFSIQFFSSHCDYSFQFHNLHRFIHSFDNWTMKGSVAALFGLAISFVHAANHQVTLGLNGLVYSPNSVTAAVGDTIEFIVTGVSSHLTQNEN